MTTYAESFLAQCNATKWPQIEEHVSPAKTKGATMKSNREEIMGKFTLIDCHVEPLIGLSTTYQTTTAVDIEKQKINKGSPNDRSLFT